MTPRRILLPLFATALLAACTSPETAPPGARVATEAEAIAIAQASCEAVVRPSRPGEWKATLSQGVWWMNLGYEAEVQVDAVTGVPTECLQTIIVG